MGKITIVSADGHATMPPDLWPEYLEPEFHDYLPRLRTENAMMTRAFQALNDRTLSPAAMEVFDREGLYRSERWVGAWDADVRLAELDREGVTAEFIFHGHFKATDLFYSVSNSKYPVDAIEAGVRAYDRWAHDTFGAWPDRFLLVGATGSALDRESTLRELEWIADHGFVGTYMPGFTRHPGQAPADDPHWEPVWSYYEERGLVLVVHGGWGLEPGLSFGAIKAATEHVQETGGADSELLEELISGIFNDRIFADLKSRQPMWQLMLGGVFDRHPDLKLMVTEMRADWVPATLQRLDAVYDEHRAHLPAKRRPSEYWRSNCMAGLSFMHRCEIEMREQIGVETMSFGRDYPHTEGTWPNTRDYLRDLFVGVPPDEVRLILGENLVRFLDLDRARIAAVTERVGFDVDDITVPQSDVAPALIDHFQDRCGYLKPPEGDSRLAELEPMLRDDLARVAALG